MVKIPPTGIALEEIERQAMIEALKMSNWVQKDAAELLAISPRVMNYKIKTLGIDYSRGGASADRSESQSRATAVAGCSSSRVLLRFRIGTRYRRTGCVYAFGCAFR